MNYVNLISFLLFFNWGKAEVRTSLNGCLACRAWCVGEVQRSPPPERSGARKGRIFAEERGVDDSPKSQCESGKRKRGVLCIL